MSTMLEAALRYAESGLSVLPLDGKKPSGNWTERQNTIAPKSMIWDWHERGVLKNVGIVCGTVSSNLVVIDLDGDDAVRAYEGRYPHLLSTFAVKTGSGKGKHYYYRTTAYTDSLRAVGTSVGNVEMRAAGLYVVAPPSIHPDTHQPYTVCNWVGIKTVANLTEVDAWVWTLIELKYQAAVRRQPSQRQSMSPNARINPAVIRAVVGSLEAKKGYRCKGDWVFGPCVMSERHKHGDKNPSFGFHIGDGRACCFTCGNPSRSSGVGGFIRTIDVCTRLSIDVNKYGGLWAK